MLTHRTGWQETVYKFQPSWNCCKTDAYLCTFVALILYACSRRWIAGPVNSKDDAFVNSNERKRKLHVSQGKKHLAWTKTVMLLSGDKIKNWCTILILAWHKKNAKMKNSHSLRVKTICLACYVNCFSFLQFNNSWFDMFDEIKSSILKGDFLVRYCKTQLGVSSNDNL